MSSKDDILEVLRQRVSDDINRECRKEIFMRRGKSRVLESVRTPIPLKVQGLSCDQIIVDETLPSKRFLGE